MTQTQDRYGTFAEQDFGALPAGKSMILHIDGLYSVLVGRAPLRPEQFDITPVNNLNGAIMPVIAPAEDVAIHVNKAIEQASAQVTRLYENTAARYPNLEQQRSRTAPCQRLRYTLRQPPPESSR